MVSSKAVCSISSWYPEFSKDALDTVILPLSDDILKYLEHDAFILPVEATNDKICESEWTDGLPVNHDSLEVKMIITSLICLHMKKYLKIFIYNFI